MSAAFIDLTTVAEVNALLAQAAGTDAAIIQTEITNLSRYILTKTSRGYLGGFLSYSETYNGNGSDRLQLRNYPILAVTSLTIGTTAIQQSATPDLPGFVIDTSGSQAALAIRGGGRYGNWSAGETPWRGGGWGNGNAPALGSSTYRFSEGVQNVAVSYTAGYVATQYSEPQTVGAGSPYQATVSEEGTFWQDLGVTLANGTPVTGYTVAAGVYAFPASYAGQAVLITYQYGAIPDDLNECATKIVATYYRRPKYLDQTSQVQPGVGTTAYSRAEWPAECMSIIKMYKRVFQD